MTRSSERNRIRHSSFRTISESENTNVKVRWCPSVKSTSSHVLDKSQRGINISNWWPTNWPFSLKGLIRSKSKNIPDELFQNARRPPQASSVAQSFSPSSCPTLYMPVKQEMGDDEIRQIQKDRQKKDNHNLSKIDFHLPSLTSANSSWTKATIQHQRSNQRTWSAYSSIWRSVSSRKIILLWHSFPVKCDGTKATSSRRL